MNSKIIIKNSLQEIAEAFGELLKKGVEEKNDRFNLALSGGTTPEIIFDYLTQNFADKINWEKINFFWGDERCVPSDHPESNFLMASEHLFEKLNIKNENVFPVNGDEKPEIEAQRYSEVILKNVPIVNSSPSFDMVMLGLGEDGHTASIFPNSIELINNTGICAVSQHPALCQKRITFTGNVINNSKRVLFMVTGKKKSKIVDIILNRRQSYEKYPAAHIQPLNGELIWLFDNAAAEHLS